MVGERLVVFADPVERRADRPGDVDPGPLGVVCGLSIAPAEAHRSGQLVGEELDLVSDPGRLSGVAEGGRFVTILLELEQAIPVARLGLIAQDRAGIWGAGVHGVRGTACVAAAGVGIDAAPAGKVERVELPAR